MVPFPKAVHFQGHLITGPDCCQPQPSRWNRRGERKAPMVISNARVHPHWVCGWHGSCPCLAIGSSLDIAVAGNESRRSLGRYAVPQNSAET